MSTIKTEGNLTIAAHATKTEEYEDHIDSVLPTIFGAGIGILIAIALAALALVAAIGSYNI